MVSEYHYHKENSHWSKVIEHMHDDWTIEYHMMPRFRCYLGCYATKSYLLIIGHDDNNNLAILYDLLKKKSYNIATLPQVVIHELLFLETDCYHEFFLPQDNNMRYWITEKSIMCELEWKIHPLTRRLRVQPNIRKKFLFDKLFYI